MAQTGRHVSLPTGVRGPGSGPGTGVWDSGASWGTDVCPQHARVDSAEEGRGPQPGTLQIALERVEMRAISANVYGARARARHCGTWGPRRGTRAAYKDDRGEAERWPTAPVT